MATMANGRVSPAHTCSSIRQVNVELLLVSPDMKKTKQNTNNNRFSLFPLIWRCIQLTIASVYEWSCYIPTYHSCLEKKKYIYMSHLPEKTLVVWTRSTIELCHQVSLTGSAWKNKTRGPQATTLTGAQTNHVFQPTNGLNNLYHCQNPRYSFLITTLSIRKQSWL